MIDAWVAFGFGAVVAQRVWELRLARSNAGRIRRAGGYEVGASHYPAIVALHVCFFAGVLLEYGLRTPDRLPPWFATTLAAFLLLQAARLWCIRTLGMYWNTRIFVVPGMRPIRRGPYRWLRHPNYAIVTLEFVCFPLLFGCVFAALLFPLLNLLVLRRRIAVEERALLAASARI